MIWAHL